MPVIVFLVPGRTLLNAHVLKSWDELIDDQVLESDFASELPDTVHQIFSLVVDDFSHVVKFILGHAIASLNALDLIVDLLQLFLLRGEVLAKLQFHILFGG